MERPSDPASARAAGRFSLEYLLRALQLVGDLLHGEILTGIVAVGVIVANTQHLDRGDGEAPKFAALDDMPPDAARRPVSVHALAASLGLPYETTRRHVNRLIESGVCARVAGGVVATAAGLTSRRNDEALLTNLANLRRLYRNLKRAGVPLE